jgi:very-short-patch-repair endonuclease
MRDEKRPVDRSIAAWAARQYGVIARWQLMLLGLGEKAIAYRVACGRLHVIHEGVYAVGHSRIGRSGRLMAAVLAFPAGAVLSHRTAAEVWGILRPTSGRPHVTSAHRFFHGKPDITLHRVRSLPIALTTEIDGLPVTTIERTLLDLASARDLHPLRRAWQEAQRRGLLDVRAVADLCDNSPGRRVRPLRALIAEATDAPDTREEFEHRFADFLRSHRDLPPAVHNVLIEGYLVDVYFPGTGLIIELDSREYHWHRREEDSERDADLAIAGYVTYRVTWRALTRRPDQTAEKIRRLLRTAPSPTPAARADGA